MMSISKWLQTLTLVVFAGLAVVGALYLRSLITVPEVAMAGPVRHHVAAPTIGQVRKLAGLVTLDVPITDVHTAKLEGATGGVSIVVAVAGDVQIATDLESAAFVDIDRATMSAILRLRRPAPDRPRVDHERTRIVGIERSGLWGWVPGSAGEKTLTDHALREAQRRLLIAADDPKLVKQACEQTETVVRDFFGALGWSVRVQWDEAADASGE